MNPLKKLASQTAIYGLPTIVGRLLNYFLTPLFTYVFLPSEFGDVTMAYAYVAFLLVFLAYGMETSLFRFSQTENNKDEVYSTVLISICTTSILFVSITSFYSNSIAEFLQFSGHAEYVVWFAIILATDAISSIPFAKLRLENKAKRFALIRSLNILLNIGFNLFFIVFCKDVHESSSSVFKPFVETFYSPSVGIGYIFISNLIASVVTILLLLPEFRLKGVLFNGALLKRILTYALPLLFAGMAGMANESFDRAMIPHLIEGEYGKAQNGIYGACYKVAVLMTIFIQAFRFAAEPFFFNRSKEADSKEVIAEVMKYFVMICSVIFLATMMNISWIQYFVGAPFREGMKVVPILLVANLFFGVFINQSIWYKLAGKTIYGAFLTVFGAVITIGLNYYLIPIYGYVGSAWATLICYTSMMFASYFLGNKHYPVNYDLKRIVGYFGISLILFFVSLCISIESQFAELVVKNVLLGLFIFILWKYELKKLIVTIK